MIQKTAVDGEEADKQLKHIRWNSSDQGRRLQREISYINLSRNTKRASEVVSYRVDPMYMMSGFKIDLQNRYGIKEEEIKKLQEMEHLRETFSSNLKTLKSQHPSSFSSNKMVRTKHSSLADKNPPLVKSKDVNIQQAQSNEQVTEDDLRQTTESVQQLQEDTNEPTNENNLEQQPDNTEEENNEQHTVE
ncbi:hypothetical protein Btru_068061 [Bulinus truncatus]|nr:hypothetical protein Btru_068061 [Bulinus truncatus]